MKTYYFLLLLLVGCVSKPIDSPQLVVSEDFSFVKSDEIDDFYKKIIKVRFEHEVSLSSVLSELVPGSSTLAPIPLKPTTLPATSPTTLPVKITKQRYLSGVVIKETKEWSYILTAAHGLLGISASSYTGCKVSWVYDQTLVNGPGYSAFLLFIDYDADICIVKTKRIGCGAVEIVDNKYPKILSDIILAGYPYGEGMVLNRSRITSYFDSSYESKQYKRDYIKIRFPGPIEAGYSGGAILGSDHRLIGVMLSRMNSTDGIGLTGYEISRLIEDLEMP